MGSLDGRSQRLLSLRAGLHGSPRSAGAVARILHVSAGREQLLERMSLLALQTAGRGGCGGSSALTTVPVSGPAQLTSAAPWVTASSTTPVSTGSGSRSATGSTASQQHVRAAGGRSAAPVVVTPAAIRTVEQASTGRDAVSWPEIILLVLLVMAVGLVLVPEVRRRLLPALAALPPAEGYVGRAGTPMASVTAQSAPAPTASAPPPEPTGSAPSPEPGVSAAPPEVVPASPGPEPQPQPEGPALHHQPVAQPQPRSRSDWMHEHATQGALVATVLAGGLVRILRRGRRQ